MKYVYLHGFASGPGSRKAQAFRAALERKGAEVLVPDLAGGNFEGLTISRQLDVLERTLRGTAGRLIGSSMGGYLAALYAAAHPEVDRLVLLAPAFGFARRWEELVGPAKLREWNETGWLDVYHYGDRAMRRVHYELYEDALRYPIHPDFRQPARIFHGIHDDTIPVDLSRTFISTHPDASLTELNSDHELLNALDCIVSESLPFLLAE
jgi:pimeloyl-ACP methyl ester carboxylesterase